jgi:hypothetical protein
MERKLAELALMLLLIAFAFGWGRWCAGQARGRGWDLEKAGRFTWICLLLAAPVLFYQWRLLFSVFPLMLGASRWACFRALRPGVPYSEVEEQFQVLRNSPITLNLSAVEPSDETR